MIYWLKCSCGRYHRLDPGPFACQCGVRFMIEHSMGRWMFWPPAPST
jgi:hypothetical protein